MTQKKMLLKLAALKTSKCTEGYIKGNNQNNRIQEEKVQQQDKTISGEKTQKSKYHTGFPVVIKAKF